MSPGSPPILSFLPWKFASLRRASGARQVSLQGLSAGRPMPVECETLEGEYGIVVIKKKFAGSKLDIAAIRPYSEPMS